MINLRFVERNVFNEQVINKIYEFINNLNKNTLK